MNMRYIGFIASTISYIALAVPAHADTYFARQILVKAANSAPSTPSDPNTGNSPSQGTPAWQIGDWSSPSSACSVNATETRSVTCNQSDGTVVADAQCSATAKPATSQQLSTMDSCTYSPIYGTLSACTGGVQTATYKQCMRSDGQSVDKSFCNSANLSQPCVVSTSCGTMTSRQYAVGGSAAMISGTAMVVSLPAARDLCNTYISNHPGAGVCYLNSNSGSPNQYKVFFYSGATIGSNFTGGDSAAACH